MASPDWSAIRAQIHLDPTVTMLNTGSFGPLPRPVFDLVTKLRLMLAAGPTDFFVRQAPPLLWEARARTAAFLGTRPERFIFTTNVSAAINLIASSLRLSSPGDILITDHEYGAMVWCWDRAGQRQGLAVRAFALPTMASDSGEIVEAAMKAMTPRTRLFFFSHVLSPTGLVLPAKELCAAARQRGIITVVDGAHAPAMLNLNIDDIDADFYTGNLHKWLLAPSGAGFLALGPGSEDRLQPLHVSWGYRHDAYPIADGVRSAGPDTRDSYGSTPRTRFLEFEGTRDFCPWLAVPAAIDFQAALGWQNVRVRIAELAEFTRRTLGGAGLALATPTSPELHGAMTAFEVPTGGALQRGSKFPTCSSTARQVENLPPRLRKELWKLRIEVPLIERPDRLLLRVSHHFYTTETEIERLGNAIRTFLG